MTPILRGLLLLHLLGAMAWMGGMAFVAFCLRPAAAETLDPPQRLPLWVATLARFLRLVAGAVVVLLISGLALLGQVGLRAAPAGWLVMTALGGIMAAVFAYVYLALFPRLRTHCRAAAWPAAAAVLNLIRRLVALNLVLGVVTVAAAVAARF
jgi:uncharacterized membrane protein